MSSFEEAKQALMKEGSGGGNVFDHLSGVILKILSENPEDAVAQFENMSLAVKKTAFVQAAADGTAAAGLSDEAKAAQIAAADSTLAKLKVGEDGATDAPQVQDLLGDAALLEWAGVSIGQGAWFQLAAYMKNLVKEQAEAEDDALEIEKIRFWGKVLGSKGVDYYVYECQAPGREIEVRDQLNEGRARARGRACVEHARREGRGVGFLDFVETSAYRHARSNQRPSFSVD